MLLQLVGQAQAPGAGKGGEAFAGGDVRLHLAAVDAVAADAVEEAGLVLVDEQGLPGGALDDLRPGVHGDDHAVGGEEAEGVEGGGPGGDHAAPSARSCTSKRYSPMSQLSSQRPGSGS